MYFLNKFIRFNRIHKLFRSLTTKAHDESSFFITAPIFYVNGDPHIGHLYTLVMADAINRFHGLLGIQNKMFLVGTDEHGVKIQKTAASLGISPEQLCDKISLKFKHLYDSFDLTYTHFIRTTDKKHKIAVEHFWNILYEKGFIYKSTYSGWYSIVEESFVPELNLTVNDEGKKVSMETGSLVEWCEEDNYLFRLSEFRQVLSDWLEQKAVVRPANFHNDLKLAVERGLKDISVSRPKSRLQWGIEVPNDKNHIIYVWLDALISYLTVAGFPEKLIKWPPDYQLIGKDILRFHGIYWPAFLMAANLDPPKSLLCHSHWTVDDLKMSKSKGNVIDPFDKAKLYTHEGLRYFLLRQGVPDSDGNYNDEKLKNYLNSELADTLGNLLSRCTSKSINVNQVFPYGKYCEIAFEQEPEATELISSIKELTHRCKIHYTNGNFYLGIQEIMDCLRFANLYFTKRQPWILAKQTNLSDELNAILYIILESLRVSAILLQPIIPKIADNILTRLNIPQTERTWKDATHSFCLEHIHQTTKMLNSGSSKVFAKLSN